jgi:hypothetical protein
MQIDKSLQQSQKNPDSFRLILSYSYGDDYD